MPPGVASGWLGGVGVGVARGRRTWRSRRTVSRNSKPVFAVEHGHAGRGVEHGHAGRGVMIDAPDFDVKIRETRVRDFEGREAGASLGHRETFRLVELDGLGLAGVEGDDLAGGSGRVGVCHFR